MRCKNCGWENEPGVLKCSKCNAPLSGSMVDSDSHNKQESYYNQSFLKGTIPEKAIFGQDQMNMSINTEGNAEKTCLKCGYQVSPHMDACPICGTPLVLDNKPKNSQGVKKCPHCGNAIVKGPRFCPYCGKPLKMGTINNWAEANSGAFFTLQPIPWEKENIQYQPASYCGECIELNRANTDPNNNSITSKTQAVISRSNEKWYIEDKSEYQSTMIRVSGKVELHDGDIIILGTRKFIFKG